MLSPRAAEKLSRMERLHCVSRDGDNVQRVTPMKPRPFPTVFLGGDVG